jgi:hypothetical protein
MTWVLIVIVSFGLSVRTGGGVTNVAGYRSKEACEKAAVEAKEGRRADVGVTAYCITGP